MEPEESVTEERPLKTSDLNSPKVEDGEVAELDEFGLLSSI